MRMVQTVVTVIVPDLMIAATAIRIPCIIILCPRNTNTESSTTIEISDVDQVHLQVNCGLIRNLFFTKYE